jgi:hypothetical protein
VHQPKSFALKVSQVLPTKGGKYRFWEKDLPAKNKHKIRSNSGFIVL